MIQGHYLTATYNQDKWLFLNDDEAYTLDSYEQMVMHLIKIKGYP